SHGADYVLPAPPGADLGERIGSDDEKQLVVRSHGPRFLDRVDGVTSLGAFLQPRGCEPRVAGAGQFHHPDTVAGAGMGACLMRRPGRRNEQHTVEMESVCRFARYLQMRAVHGVERAAEKRQPQGYLSSLMAMLRNQTCIGGPRCNCSAITPSIAA